eukprot:snap_masked-scaffold_12-processed-gene-5.45-mRNA-1 protein AED:1.00 eAED:1.00 QI:0/0/0/0/1/1/2/0/66
MTGRYKLLRANAFAKENIVNLPFWEEDLVYTMLNMLELAQSILFLLGERKQRPPTIYIPCWLELKL